MKNENITLIEDNELISEDEDNAELQNSFFSDAVINLESTFVQIEKALINNRLVVLKVSWKCCIPIYNYIQIQ